MADLYPGRQVWLTARTLTAPRVCWSEPEATVHRIEHPFVVVDVRGEEHRVHEDNVRTSDPRATRVVHVKPKFPPQWDGYDQPSLL